MPDEWQERLNFEREKWRDESQLRREEQNLKRQELARSGWRSPLVVAIAAAGLAAVGNGAISLLDGRQQRALEQQRTVTQIALEDRKSEAARILEMIRSGDATAVRNNLQFLIEAGLIENEDLADRLETYLAETPDERIPRLPQQIDPATIGSRRLHVLAIGIDTYAEPEISGLIAPARDAEAVAEAAAQQRGRLYADVSSLVLTNSQATRANIASALDQLTRRASTARGDVALVHFSGHAFQEADEFYLVPYDARLDGNSTSAAATSISLTELGRLLTPLIESTYVVLTIDACPGSTYRSPEAALPHERLTVVVAALPGQLCLDSAQQNHGALTWALLEVISGQGDQNGDGAITVSELVGHLLRRVPEITQGKQVPAASFGFDGIVLQAGALAAAHASDGAASPEK
jgi:hypothetical protein